MAMEALKSAGIQAYQGSSRKSAVKAAPAAASPEAPAVARDIKIVENAVQTAEGKQTKVLEPKAEAKAVQVTAGNDAGSRKVQERAATRDTVKMPDSLPQDSKEAAEGAVSNESLKRAVEEMNKKAANSEAVFGVHESTNRVTIKIVDKKTKEVLKEYPPEKTLDMIAKVWELAGLLVDEKR